MKKDRTSIQELRDAVAELREAALNVIDNWEHGDLAAAVRNMDRVLNEQSTRIRIPEAF